MGNVVKAELLHAEGKRAESYTHIGKKRIVAILAATLAASQLIG